ncbi:MAG: hypothetical protein ACUVQ1_07860 [Candidatus Kapaibacteriales bacterium]
METIETLSSIEGRKLLSQIFHELRYRKQMSNLSILTLTWRICTSEREISKYTNQEVQVLHPLGFFSGTALWMEEVVNRFYFSPINSLVYLGAAILLVLIGLRRFNPNMSDTIVIAGVIFEALMLLFMFIVMLFTPSEDAFPISQNSDLSEIKETSDELVREIGEIGTDFAEAVENLKSISEGIFNLTKQQNELIKSVNEANELTRELVAPNPKLIEILSETNKSLLEFKNKIESINETLNQLKQEKIETTVKTEIEKLFSNLLNNRNDKQ